MTSTPDLSQREKAWGATMRGTATGGVEIAHSTTEVQVGAEPSLDRRAREELEDRTLRVGATRSAGAGRRLVDEAPDATRTCYERDRDRIVHATAFRRLAGKTQVFVAPDDHQRTRLTHALEVAQVARSVARALALNSALTEAIALGHDCGHGPGGHASEDAFGIYLPDGFDHAVWGADVTLTPLNLCRETLDGIRNHSWSRPAPSTPEAEVVSWADRIAYVCHDFEDAVATGIVASHELPDVVLERCGNTRRTQLAAFIAALVSATERTGHIGMTTEGAEALAAFRAFNYERIYLRKESREQARRVIAVLRALVDHLVVRPDRIPGRLLDEGHDVDRLQHAAVEWVAGMTDRYAVRAAVEWTGYDAGELPRGLIG